MPEKLSTHSAPLASKAIDSGDLSAALVMTRSGRTMTAPLATPPPPAAG